MLLYYGLLWLTVLLCSGAFAQTEVPARVVTLLDENSYVDYKPVEWNYTGDGSQLILPIRFRTRSIRGRLITLTAQATQGTVFTLYAYIDNAAVVVDLIDGDGKLIKKTERQLPGANSGAEHSMSIHLNPETKILKMVYGQGTVDSYDFTDSIKVEPQMQLSIKSGNYGERASIIGCVAIVGLTMGSRFVFELEESERFSAVRDGCDTLCVDDKCNKGTCIDLFHSAVCDCRGTYQSGERCDQVMKTLNVSWDQYISYKISENESQPAVISINFKTEVKEGLIIHGTILSLETDEPLGNLKLALIYGQLRLTIANLAEINFDNVILSSDKFNQILLEFDYGLDIVHMTFNGNTKSVTLNTEEKENHIRFGSELFFSAGDSEVGLSGCLRGIYVGHFDVIDGYASGSPKVNASVGLKNCDGKDLVPIIVPNLAILVREEELPEKPLDEIITEEHEKQENEAEAPELDHEQEHEEKGKSDSDTHAHANESDDERDKQIQQEQARFKVEEDMQAAIGESVMMKIVPEAPAKQLCDNDEATSCKNSVECVKEGTVPVCVCRKGYAGKYCQFSLLPWNCDEILSEGNTVPGNYIIDPDGSGPLRETYVYCQHGQTIIPHNMPNYTLIHSSELGDIQAVINYKLFNDELLESLKNRSENCKQTVLYDCRQAPLNFGSMKTWFKSISNKAFAGFGGNGGTCPCTNGRCAKCNCDSGDIAADSGIMVGAEAPIRRIYSLNGPSDNKGYLTLSPLICSGSAGRSAAYTMNIRKQFEPVAIGSWSGNSLSFDFRTYLENATLIASRDGKVEISMVERVLHLMFDNQINLTLIPQSRKSDGFWHRIIVDIRDGSVRFSVDDTVETAEIKQPSFTTTQLDIGGGKNGFLGCVRQILLDGELKPVDLKLQGKCTNQCDVENGCKHESRCEEDFATNSVRCVCKNYIVHSGAQCQNSINYGTEVSFHDARRAFLKAQNPTVENALMQRIVFSFRTDRRDALLIYLHDQLYNFVQVHLSDHSHMVLTLNFNRTIRRCEVVSKVGNEFSRMKWIQVMIFQWPDRTELNVDDEICQISGQRTLSSAFIETFDITPDMGDVVEPPVSPVRIEGGGHNHPYVLLFVAGVPTHNDLGNLEPIYRSSIPNLLGCMRGLMLGSQLLDMRREDYWAYYPTKQDMIKFGCETGCHKVDELCKNGGHCAVEWTAKFVEEDASCNCDRTSYYGEYCDEDSGAFFTGHSLLTFNVDEIFEKVIFDWSQTGEHAFSFAFSTTDDANAMRPQALATIYFDHNRMMEIILCKNGSLNVGITSKDTSYVYTFPYNYDDGYRHYFQSTFRSSKPLKVTVDSWKYVFPNSTRRLTLAHASKFVFGGSELTTVEGKSGDKKLTKYNYTGCISNIDINMNVARMHFKPILYLQKPELEFAESVTVLGDELRLGACNSFLIPGNIPPVLNIVTSPVWDSPFVVEPYVRAKDDKLDGEKSEGGSAWWIILIILLILLLLCIIFAAFYYWKKKKENKQPTPPPADPNHKNGVGEQEQLPLLPGTDKEKQPLTIKDAFILPEPDQHLDQVHVSSVTRNASDIGPATPTHALAPEVVVTQQPPLSSRVGL